MTQTRSNSIKLNVGCGSFVTPGYENLDNSPSLLVQNNLIFKTMADIAGRLLKRRFYTPFPKCVKRWDINRGLPFTDASVEVVYSSHMLEHIPRSQVETFLEDVYRILKPGGILRLALPDLELMAREFLSQVELARAGQRDVIPADQFMESTLLGLKARPNLLQPMNIYRELLVRTGHLWMWDAPSLSMILQKIEFKEVNEGGYRESHIPEVDLLDLEGRRFESFYLEALK